MPYDQRLEDGDTRVYDSAPLKEPLEILIAPQVELEVEANREVAMLAVRLSDIAADNKATRFTYGLLNLTHRDSSENPKPLKPGKRYVVKMTLNHVAQRLPAGHRIRISISASYWPMAWPPPKSAAVTLFTGKSRLILPQRRPRQEDARLRSFDEPEAAAPLREEIIRPEKHNWQVIRDLADDISRLEVIADHGCRHIKEIDMTFSRLAREWYTFERDDFNSVMGETFWERTFSRGNWRIRTVTRAVLSSTPEHFYLRAELDAYESDKRVYSQNWDYVIPRDLV